MAKMRRKPQAKDQKTQKRGEVTTIQVSPTVRDRLYRLKFRKTYDEFLAELCDFWETQHDPSGPLNS